MTPAIRQFDRQPDEQRKLIVRIKSSEAKLEALGAIMDRLMPYETSLKLTRQCRTEIRKKHSMIRKLQSLYAREARVQWLAKERAGQ